MWHDGPMSDLIKTWLEHHRGQVRIKSQAMTPLAWLCAMALPAGVTGFYFSTGAWRIFFAALVAAPILAYLWAYHYWAKNDPDRLGSEAFLEKRHFLRVVEQAKDPQLLRNAFRELSDDPEPSPKKVIQAKTQSVADAPK